MNASQPAMNYGRGWLKSVMADSRLPQRAKVVAWAIEDQYMLGSSLMVVPILTPLAREAKRRFYLPAGTWYDYWTKERIDSSGEWREASVRIEQLPIFVRANSLVPYTSARQRTGNTLLPIVRVEAYPAEHGGSTTTFEVTEGSSRFSWTLTGKQISAGQEDANTEYVVIGGDNR